jgi:hypothetical protein
MYLITSPYFIGHIIVVHNVKYYAIYCGHNDWNKKVKKEGGSSRLNLNGKGFATPLYSKILPFFSHNGSSYFARIFFYKEV